MKKKCMFCNQINDGTMDGFMKLKSCNAADGDGHFWIYNVAYKTPFTQKFPFQYIVKVKSYSAQTTNEQAWINLQKHLEENELFDFTPEMVTKLEASMFTITRNYGG